VLWRELTTIVDILIEVASQHSDRGLLGRVAEDLVAKKHSLYSRRISQKLRITVAELDTPYYVEGPLFTEHHIHVFFEINSRPLREAVDRAKSLDARLREL
jgi:hypothetical protein